MMAGVALVTGAGSGIGRAGALALGRAGFSVVLAGRRPAPLEAVAHELSSEGHKALVCSADVARDDDVAHLFERAVAHFGRLDVLFNNAGVFMPATKLEDVDPRAWRSVVDVNLTGVFLCTQAAFRVMKAQQPMGGRIINNGSISAHAPRPHSIAYTATKHAITGLTKSAALDGREYDIAVSQIDIGNAETDMTQRMKQGVLQADGAVRPEPVMDLAHVADALVYMARLPLSANVQFITLMATQMPFIGRG
jgi:NAD(P)-dependent dehydrogenase (short-subunit alcohol dehydrogenase family)